jgi:hypothetical protein
MGARNREDRVFWNAVQTSASAPGRWTLDRMHEGAAGAEPPQRLNQPATEYFVGGRDLTR